MKFTSESGKAAGKRSSRKGVPNKLTRPIKQAIAEFTQGHFEEFEKRMKKLGDRDYCNAYLKLLEYVTPKQVRQETSFDLNGLSDTQIELVMAILEGRPGSELLPLIQDEEE